MSTLPAIQSKQPASSGNLGAGFGEIFRKFIQRIDGQLPAEIISYNRQKNVAMVQPLISLITTSGNRIVRAPIAVVPVLALGGGGVFINFPLKKGDRGWIEASDRDISLYMQTGAQSPPNTKRMHSFEDARFIPDVFDEFSYGLTDDAATISSLDGSVRIELLPGGTINLIAPTINNQCETYNVVTGAFNVQTGTLSINATEAGGTGITGNVNLPVTTNIGGIAYPDHEHDSVQHGTDNSGGVVGL